MAASDGRNEQDSSEPFEIVTSLDGPFAIYDSLKSSIGMTRNCLLVSEPYVSKDFVSFLRDVVPKGVEIYFLTSLPEKKNWSFEAVDCLVEIADSKGWKFMTKCDPKLHNKFFVVDGKECLVTSANATQSGMYNNHETLHVLREPSSVQKYREYFFRLWKQPESISWQNVRQFYGHKVVDHRSTMNAIAEKIVAFFLGNGNSPTIRWKVCKEMVRLGYEESDVIAVIRNLAQDGVLYEPKLDYICLASARLD